MEKLIEEQDIPALIGLTRGLFPQLLELGEIAKQIEQQDGGTPIQLTQAIILLHQLTLQKITVCIEYDKIIKSAFEYLSSRKDIAFLAEGVQ